ncbi:hypothetical protein [Pontibaca methylaminivorans]|uniref:Uncharacterized protein n=1 Tax=Pontibaca methylaminivorans TaxID=515897 RepID=A0A1R3WWF2_9RHOB|nr:hypothetical protein [Pontibaca methylaminivorans]SIT82401.1 hypothetical protein SAMN05421849_1687 [Pontibaca methylaminivorans]
MAQSNRILTVSYGTFSCTLEGFDDSVGAMKEVADHFRRIAGEEPRFGAPMMTPEAQAAGLAAFSMHRPSAPGAMEDNPTGPGGVRGIDSIAERLRRIRAVVARSDTPDDALCEDEPEDIFVSTVAQDIGTALQHEDEAGVEAPDERADEELAGIFARLDMADQIPTPGIAADPDMPASPETASLPVTPPALPGNDEDSDGATGSAPPPPGDGIRIPPAPAHPDMTAPQAAPRHGEESAQTDDPARNEAEGTRVDDLPDPAAAAGSDMATPADLPCFEAEIVETVQRHRLLPVVTASLPDSIGTGTTESEATMPLRATPSCGNGMEEDGGAKTGSAAPPRETELARLAEAADSRMGEQRTASNHAAYEQMRAAVAHKRIEPDAGPETDGSTAYRADLAEVIRPRRPVLDGTHVQSARPDMDAQLPPLRLVAEQRVDPARPEPRPVRPRRVAPAALNGQATPRSGAGRTPPGREDRAGTA